MKKYAGLCDRDIALRCPKGAARRPYLRDPVTPEEEIDAVVQQAT
jgi:hypothetical protein